MALFFVTGADADGDVGVPVGSAGRVMGTGAGRLPRDAILGHAGGSPKVDWSKITISKIYLLLELLYANGHSWYLDRFG
jgi:hypothetical protein